MGGRSGRMILKKITIRLDPTTHKKFRLYCVEHGTSAQALIEQYILELLDQNQNMDNKRRAKNE